MPMAFFHAFIAYMNMTQGPNFYDNEVCVKTLYNSLYWTAVKKVNDEEADEDDDKFGLYLFLGIAIGAVFVIAILLLVIYFKRRKTDEDEEETSKEKLTTP